MDLYLEVRGKILLYNLIFEIEMVFSFVLGTLCWCCCYCLFGCCLGMGFFFFFFFFGEWRFVGCSFLRGGRETECLLLFCLVCFCCLILFCILLLLSNATIRIANCLIL